MYNFKLYTIQIQQNTNLTPTEVYYCITYKHFTIAPLATTRLKYRRVTPARVQCQFFQRHAQRLLQQGGFSTQQAGHWEFKPARFTRPIIPLGLIISYHFLGSKKLSYGEWVSTKCHLHCRFGTPVETSPTQCLLEQSDADSTF